MRTARIFAHLLKVMRSVASERRRSGNYFLKSHRQSQIHTEEPFPLIPVYPWLLFFAACLVRFSRSATMVDKTMAINTTVATTMSETFVGISS